MTQSGGATREGDGKLPRLEAVRELVEGLVGQSVTLTPGGKIRSNLGGTIAVYVDDDDRPAAFAISDVAFAAYCGAALAMVPAHEAHRVVLSKKLDDALAENYHEVVNVAASLFCDIGPHVRLKEVLPLSRDLPDDIVFALRRPTARMAMRADIAGFGQGQLALAVA
ncbi:MAG: hypothetical protein AAF928_01980 [Myxococcota bacterium]